MYPSALLVVLLIVVLLSIRRVPADRVGVVERLGKGHRELRPGWHLGLPIVDRVAHTVDVRPQRRQVVPVDTVDNSGEPVGLLVDYVFRVTRPLDWVYSDADPALGLDQCVGNAVRGRVADLDRGEVLADPQRLASGVRLQIEAPVRAGGAQLDDLRVTADAFTR